MTSQGTARGRFQRAIERGHLLAAETAAREMGSISLSDALALCLHYERERDARSERAFRRWLSRVRVECDLRHEEVELLRSAAGALRTPFRELLGLRWDDLDLDEGVLRVERQLTRSGDFAPPKTAKGVRRVPLSSNMVALLRKHKLASRFSQGDNPVFASRAGGSLSHRNVQRRGCEPARDLAGLPESVTFHKLRHAFASIAAHRGVPVSVLSEVMGHSHVGVTQEVYMHLYGREQAEDAFRGAMGAN